MQLKPINATIEWMYLDTLNCIAIICWDYQLFVTNSTYSAAFLAPFYSHEQYTHVSVRPLLMGLSKPPVSSYVLSIALVLLTWTCSVFYENNYLNDLSKGGRSDGTTLSLGGLATYLTVSLIVNTTYTAWLTYIHKTQPQHRVPCSRKVKPDEDESG